jgi:opacity protein-like surface antigen
MHKILLGCAAAALLASPAAARDRSGYFGAELGGLWTRDLDHDLTITRTVAPIGTTRISDGAEMSFKKPGLDLDLILGYDFGALRLEGEAGFKRASLDEIGLRAAPGGALTTADANGHVGVTSAMANLLLDFGNDEGLSLYAGPGIGWARVKMSNIQPAGSNFDIEGSDSGLALQGIAGVRFAITPQLDVGLKYRFFRSSRLEYGNIIEELNAGGASFDARSRFRSHSLLFSVIYNFAEPAAPPPPPPPPPPPQIAVEAPTPPPATQTCPDGSVVLATDACPVPPPAPPPPPATPERG